MSLREAIESAVNTAEAAQSEPVTPEAPAQTEVKTEAPAPQETAEQKAGRTAGRERDEHGRLLPGKAVKPEPQTPAPQAQTQQQQTRTPAPKYVPPPPSSWKRDHWESWHKIASENPQLAAYLEQREGEFAKGVSTYKQEYEQVKPLAEALQPFLPTMQQHGIQPAQWITNMGTAHQRLVFGSPQEKLQMFVKLAQDYQVPIQALYDPQAQQQFLTQQMLHPQQQTPMQPDIKQTVREQIMEERAATELEQFQAATDASGNPLYPHYDVVRDDMALLLEHGKAKDLKSAYGIAIRMHDDIWQKEQEAKQAASQKTAQTAQAAQVAKAKSAAVSPRSATPGAETVKAAKGIRASVEAAVEAHEAGRV